MDKFQSIDSSDCFDELYFSGLLLFHDIQPCSPAHLEVRCLVFVGPMNLRYLLWTLRSSLIILLFFMVPIQRTISLKTDEVTILSTEFVPQISWLRLKFWSTKLFESFIGILLLFQIVSRTRRYLVVLRLYDKFHLFSFNSCGEGPTLEKYCFEIFRRNFAVFRRITLWAKYFYKWIRY